MSALTSNLPLQDMIAGVLSDATAKLAADANPFASKSSTDKSGKTTNKTGKTHATDKSAKTEKTAALTDPDYIEKLACSIEYINANLGELMPQSQGVLQTAITKLAARPDQVGAGRGATSLPTNEAGTKGRQKYTKDSPAGDDPAQSEAGAAMGTHGLPGGKTLVHNDMDKAPGQASGSVPTATYPEKGPLVNLGKIASVREYYAWAMNKVAEAEPEIELEKIAEAIDEYIKLAFSLTESGHKLDAHQYKALADMHHNMGGALKDFEKDAPNRAAIYGTPGPSLAHRLQGRHMDYAAKKHEDQQNAYNPFGGLLTKSRLEKKAFSVSEAGHKLDAANALAKVKAHHEFGQAAEGYKEDSPLKSSLLRPPAEGLSHRLQARHADYAARQHEDQRNAMNPFGGLLTKHRFEKKASAVDLILQKLAGEDVMKANIDGGGTTSPLAGMGQLTTTQAGQASPHQAGDPTGGFGNQARSLIASNQAAIDATKRSAKGPVKKQLAELLDEPALSAKHDNKLQENLRSTGQAGVKIAAARAVLQKIAEEGCTCNDSGECRHCKIKTAMKKAKSEKSKTAAAVGAQDSATMLSTGGQPSGGAGGQQPTAEAGEGADGCTCGNAGECRVCKLKAALAAARAESQRGAGGGGEQGPMPGGKDF